MRPLIPALTADGYELDPDRLNVVFVRIEDAYHGAQVTPEWEKGAWLVELSPEDTRLVRHVYRKKGNALRALALEKQDAISQLICEIKQLTAEAERADRII